MEMADALKWFNVGLALLGSLAAFGSLNKMHWRETRPCMIGAMLLTALGLGAQWIGEISGDWARIADTATFGGVLVLLVATQRMPSWALERWANPAASLIAIGVGAAVLLGLLAAPARAADEPRAYQYTLTPEDSARCDAEGGCVIVTKGLLVAVLEQAQHAVRLASEHEAARQAAERRCGPAPRRDAAVSRNDKGR